jgi:hypothetical protein
MVVAPELKREVIVTTSNSSLLWAEVTRVCRENTVFCEIARLLQRPFSEDQKARRGPAEVSLNRERQTAMKWEFRFHSAGVWPGPALPDSRQAARVA